MPARERRFDDHEEELADIISTDRDLVAAHQLRIVIPVSDTRNVYQVNLVGSSNLITLKHKILVPFYTS